MSVTTHTRDLLGSWWWKRRPRWPRRS